MMFYNKALKIDCDNLDVSILEYSVGGSFDSIRRHIRFDNPSLEHAGFHESFLNIVGKENYYNAFIDSRPIIMVDADAASKGLIVNELASILHGGANRKSNIRGNVVLMVQRDFGGGEVQEDGLNEEEFNLLYDACNKLFESIWEQVHKTGAKSMEDYYRILATENNDMADGEFV